MWSETVAMRITLHTPPRAPCRARSIRRHEVSRGITEIRMNPAHLPRSQPTSRRSPPLPAQFAGPRTAPRAQRTRSSPATRAPSSEPLEPERLDRPQRARARHRLLRRPGHERRRELVAVDPREVDLGQLAPGAVVRLGRDPGAPARRRARPPARRPAPASARPRPASPSATPGTLQHELPDERPRLQRPRQRPEPAQVDVDLAQPADTTPAARSARRRRPRSPRATCPRPGTSARARPGARSRTRPSRNAWLSPSVTPTTDSRVPADSDVGPPPSA